jgi:hypothetical protein
MVLEHQLRRVCSHINMEGNLAADAMASNDQDLASFFSMVEFSSQFPS